MSKVLRVTDGDYTVKVQNSGYITLDTGDQSGKVIITGDLEVRGNQTNVESEDLLVKDNIIFLNVGETGNGITLGTSGLEIDRGNYLNVSFLYDETLDTFVFRSADTSYVPITVNTIKTHNSDLVINTGSGTNVISVTGTNDYELHVTDDDDIPNKKYVDSAISGGIGALTPEKIYEGDTVVEAHDSSVGGDSPSRITVSVDNVEVAKVLSTGLTINNITSYSASNLILTASNSNIEINGYLNLDNQGTAPSSAAGINKVYSSSVGPGGTGIKVVNTTVSDELVSRRKALAYSMIF